MIRRSQLDIRKAFDRISYGVLLFQIGELEIVNLLLALCLSLLRRHRYVRWSYSISKIILVKLGVLLGSRLGPWLFLFYFINYMTLLKRYFVLYIAGNSKRFMEINSVSDFEILQDNLTLVMDWCSRNKVYININKCNTITSARKHNNIQ